MPHRNSSRRVLFRLVLFTLAGWALWALGRDDAKPETAVAEAATETTPAEPRRSGGFSKRRLATSLAFATLFFAGAAFSAGAGDLVVGAVEGSTESTVAETTTESSDPAPPADTTTADPAPADPAPTDPAPADPSASDPAPADGGANSSDGGQSADQPADSGDPSSDDGAAPASGGEGGSSVGNHDGNGDGGGGDGAGQPAAGPDSPNHAGDHAPPPPAEPSPVEVVAAHDADVAAESKDAFATVWLHRTLPDPTPAARRLDSNFAAMLQQTAARNGADWALVLGVLRARGHLGRVPATRQEVAQLASQLRGLNADKDAWQAVLSLAGRTAFADRTVALTHYYRAVGLRALVRGLVASKADLQDRILTDPRVTIYPGGRSDVEAGKVDVRVLALVLYLAEAHGSVTVSCLISGHRLYARPGVVSAHIYGEAVDIAALGGRPIYGNQEPGGLTEKAVRNILLLPVELRPKQVISLLGLGGPSFALANHYDHIHVGF